MNDNTQTPEQIAQETIDNLSRVYFAPAQLATANEKLAAIVSAATTLKLPVKYNFDPAKELESGYGIAVIPNQQQVKGKGNVIVGVAIAAIPDPATIAAADKGVDFINQTVVAACLAKVANAFRVRADGSTASSVPYSVTDFTTSMRGGEATLAVFNENAKDMVKALRTKGLKHITIPLLREVLQSSDFAALQYPKIEQAKWVMVLDAMIARAKAKQQDATVLESWKASRDTTEVPADSLDISGLEDLAMEAPAVQEDTASSV